MQRLLLTGNNPFYQLLKQLGISSRIVTEEYLVHICEVCERYGGLKLPNKLLAVQVLKYLENAGCIKIDIGETDVVVQGLFEYE